ncbi:MAG: membrane protein insertase YidC [Bryobacteraceae bacterium]
MANEPASNKPKLPGKSGEMSMEVRLLITFVLMGLVLFLTPYILKNTAPQPAAPQKKDAAAQKQEPPKAAPGATPAATPAPTAAADPSASTNIVAERQDDHITLETDLYRIQFSNRGAVVRSWVLKKFFDQQKKPVELVNAAGGTKLGFPFTTLTKGTAVAPDPNQVLYLATHAPNGLGVSFEYNDGKVYGKKSFEFEKDRYLVKVTSELREQGRNVPHLVAWRGGFGDFSVINTLSTQHTLYFDNNENKLIVNEVKVAKDGPVSVSGRFLFAGLEDTYFTAVALPTPGTSFEVQTWNDSVSFTRDGATKDEPHIGVALGGDGVNNARLFIGPKDVHTLRSIDPKLEQVVDWGWFGLIARPLFASLNWFNDNYIHNYGWSIVVVTILINFLLLPLKVSNVKSMKKMAALQPQVKQIQDKYSNLPMRDPRRQQQQAEMMDLYKQHGVNPLGGCVPMLLQMPFLFAFYKVLTVAIEMRGAQWLWVADLSQPEQLSLRILPLATIATQFIIQKMTPQQPGADPQQQRIMMLMPLMFIFIFWSVASGLVLYWLTGNVVGIAQQYILNKMMGVGQPAKPPEAPKKKK